VPRGAAPDTLRAPLGGPVVAIRHRWIPGKATTPGALPPVDPVCTARLGLRVASPRRLTPGRAIVPSALITPSPVLWRSVLKPLASPRRLTPGCASVPRGAPTPTLLVPLQGLSVSRPSPRPPGKAWVPQITPPQPTTALLAPLNPVRRNVCQRWLAAIGGSEPAAAMPALFSSGVRPIASPRRLTPGRAIIASALITPSPVLWRSVFQPLASPRRLTPGCASVPGGAPTPTLAVLLQGLFISSARLRGGRSD